MTVIYLSCGAGNTFLIIFSIDSRWIVISLPQPLQMMRTSLPTRNTVKVSEEQGCFFFIIRRSPQQSFMIPILFISFIKRFIGGFWWIIAAFFCTFKINSFVDFLYKTSNNVNNSKHYGVKYTKNNY